MVWTVGGAEHDLIVTEFHGREHVLAELGPVSGALEQGSFAQDRGADVEASVVVGDVLGEAFEFVADRGACGQPQWEPGPGEWVGGEDVQGAVELAVVEQVVVLVHGHSSGRGRGVVARPGNDEGPGSLRGLVDGALCQDNASAPEESGVVVT